MCHSPVFSNPGGRRRNGKSICCGQQSLSVCLVHFCSCVNKDAIRATTDPASIRLIHIFLSSLQKERLQVRSGTTYLLSKTYWLVLHWSVSPRLAVMLKGCSSVPCGVTRCPASRRSALFSGLRRGVQRTVQWPHTPKPGHRRLIQKVGLNGGPPESSMRTNRNTLVSPFKL